MRESELRFLLTSPAPVARQWRAAAPAGEWAQALVAYRRRRSSGSPGAFRLLKVKEKEHGEDKK